MDSYTDIELLAELVRRNEGRIMESPRKRTYISRHSDICLAIGKDHIADLTMDDDALAELRRLTS